MATETLPAVLPVHCDRCNTRLGRTITDQGEAALRIEQSRAVVGLPCWIKCHRCKRRMFVKP